MQARTAFNRLAAGLAFVIGAMAVFAGGQVLLGQLPDYYVIDWLPIYNLTLGLVSALFASVVIWRASRLALPTATAIFGLHAVVMLITATDIAARRSVFTSKVSDEVSDVPSEVVGFHRSQRRGPQGTSAPT